MIGLVLSSLRVLRGLLSRVWRLPMRLWSAVLELVRGVRPLFLVMRGAWLLACGLLGWWLAGPESLLVAFGLSWEAPWVGFLTRSEAGASAQEQLVSVYRFLQSWPWAIPFGDSAWSIFRLRDISPVLSALQGAWAVSFFAGAAIASWSLPGDFRYVRALFLVGFYWVLWIVVGILVSPLILHLVGQAQAPGVLDSLAGLKDHLFHPKVFVPYLRGWQADFHHGWIPSILLMSYFLVFPASGPLIYFLDRAAVGIASGFRLAVRKLFSLLAWPACLAFPFYLAGAKAGLWSYHYYYWVVGVLRRLLVLLLPLLGMGKEWLDALSVRYGETPVNLFLILSGSTILWFLWRFLSGKISAVIHYVLSGLDESMVRLGELADYVMSRSSNWGIQFLSRYSLSVVQVPEGQGSFRFTRAHRGWTQDTGALGILVSPEEEDEDSDSEPGSPGYEDDDEEYRILKAALLRSVRPGSDEDSEERGDEEPGEEDEEGADQAEESEEAGQPEEDESEVGEEPSGEPVEERVAEEESAGESAEEETPVESPEEDSGGEPEPPEGFQTQDEAQDEGGGELEEGSEGGSEGGSEEDEPGERVHRSLLSSYNPETGEVELGEDYRGDQDFDPDLVDFDEEDSEEWDDDSAIPPDNEAASSVPPEEKGDFYRALNEQLDRTRAAREESGAASFDSSSEEDSAEEESAEGESADSAGEPDGKPDDGPDGETDSGIGTDPKDALILSVSSYCSGWFAALGGDPAYGQDIDWKELAKVYDVEEVNLYSWIPLQSMLGMVLKASPRVRQAFREEFLDDSLLHLFLGRFADRGGGELLEKLLGESSGEEAPTEEDSPVEPVPEEEDSRGEESSEESVEEPVGEPAEEPEDSEEGASELVPEAPEGTEEAGEEIPFDELLNFDD